MGTSYRHCCIAVGLLLVTACKADEPPAQPEPVPELIVEVDHSAIPDRAKPYIKLFKDLENPSRSMAQMWVESRGHAQIRSPYGGIGLMQFTAPTVETADRSYCAHLAPGDPEDPYWAVPCYEAFVEYMDIEPFGQYCPDKKVDECRYNGGWWCVWELRAAPQLTFESAEDICGQVVLPNGRKRSKRGCEENYLYSEHITKFQPLFMSLGGKVCN